LIRSPGLIKQVAILDRSFCTQRDYNDSVVGSGHHNVLILKYSNKKNRSEKKRIAGKEK